MAKATNGYKPRFGYRQLVLDKERFALDEDGWVQIPTRITVGMTQNMSTLDQSDTVGFMKQIILNWHMKADGVMLPFDDEGFQFLPIDVITYVTEETSDPLEKAAAIASPPA